MEIVPILRKYEKGMQNAKLRNFAMTIGVQETRRIIGEYRITFKDVFDEKKFPDAIGIYPVCMDGPEGFARFYRSVFPGSIPDYCAGAD